MGYTMSKSKSEVSSTHDRLQQIRMGAHDRIVAEAQLARAEYLADLLLASVEFLSKGLRALVLRPFRRVTAAFN